MCAATVFFAAIAPAASDVSIAVVNARVWTGDAAHPWAEAVAASGDRILAVGSNAEIRALSGASTRVVMGARMPTPGFMIRTFTFSCSTVDAAFPPIFLGTHGTRRK